ncbi:hypothetical protein [Bacillus sp. Au-Bac7]|uniref:hypothetical protein n=1 Tax=Bacillus sp. Au-Bac7 TaxID=2906458 RepID=UPI001E5AE425|nr:hypothetical protein [Bacillus sp. Au-Bac7]MCE4048853.1 hypothetical protein [Bacillus sp. Au-Bac7]
MSLRNQNQLDQEAHQQQYFRPSCLPALNLRFNFEFFDQFGENYYNQIQLPAELTKTPEDTVVNYFSILREAENLYVRSCGSVGNAKTPYPIAYNLFSNALRGKVHYEDFINSFAGIGHISLIKLCRLPGEEELRFFYELETIHGFKETAAEFFGYSYGFMELSFEGNGYRINNIQQFSEDFLCAPYHLWQHNAESVVDVKYGDWCKLIKKRYPTVKQGYVKNIYVLGTDGAYYCFLFFTLTNGTDVEIAQFRKMNDGKWKLLKMNPDECIAE